MIMLTSMASSLRARTAAYSQESVSMQTVHTCVQSPDLAEAWPNALVIIDAGSSGSRAHIFRYRHASPAAVPHVQLPQQMHKVEPGLATFAQRPERAAEYVHEMLSWAEQQVRTAPPPMHTACTRPRARLNKVAM